MVIVSCLPKKLDAAKEPILAEVVKKFGHADIYGNAKIKRKIKNKEINVDREIRTLRILGICDGEQKVVIRHTFWL